MNRGLATGIVVVAAGSLVATFFALFERRDDTVRIPPSGEAATNRYFAAERMLEAMGTPVRKFAKPSELPDTLPEGGTLFVLSPDARFSEISRLRILDWVDGGGRLVAITGSNFESETDDAEMEGSPGVPELLAAAGIGSASTGEFGESDDDGSGDAPQERVDDADEDEERAIAEESAAAEGGELDDEAGESDDDRAKWTVATGRGPAGNAAEIRAFGIPGVLRSAEPPLWSLDATPGTHALEVRYGDGSMVALMLAEPFQNAYIGQLDHARLLHELGTRSGRREAGPAAVWLITSGDWPGILDLILAYALEAVLSLALVVALWIWASSRRVGPILPDLADERRELMEHVRAAGRFHFRHAGAAELAGGVREAVLDRVRTRHPSWLALPREELARRLAKLAELAPEAVERVLHYPDELASAREKRPNGEVFARNVATLERIRRAI